MKTLSTTIFRTGALTSALMFGIVIQAIATPRVAVTNAQAIAGGTRLTIVIDNWSTIDPTPTRCGSGSDYFNKRCTLSLMVELKDGSYLNTIGPGTWYFQQKLKGPYTLGTLLNQLLMYTTFSPPQTAVIDVPSANGGAKCIYLNLLNGTEAERLTPCAPALPPPSACTSVSSTIINHNNLLENKLDGMRSSIQMMFTCNNTTKVKISASRTNSYGVRLRNDDSLYSKIEINGKDASSGIDVTVTNQNANINISSTLITRGSVSPGLFTGNTVLTISPY